MSGQAEQLREVVRGLNTTPFLFIGSGITRRYYGLPNWEGLLELFASRVNEDEFAYSLYEDLARREVAVSQEETEMVLEPIIASLIERSFNERWFREPSFRRLNDHYLRYVKQKRVSPFKAEIAQFFANSSVEPLEFYNEEIDLFRQLFSKHISGIITTNYDTFLESMAPEYNVYIGQEQLVFSPIQGIAEIYKIHGCVTRPEEIVINHKDYLDFHNKSAYLAAKLMTIFVEYPIIFIGYSLSDPNIQTILQSIVDCLSETNLAQLQDRFIFVDYSTTPNTLNVSPSTLLFSGNRKSIRVTSVIMHDYSILYKALMSKKIALPAKIIRFFKEEFYNFTRSQTPSKQILVGSVDNPRIKDNDLILAIGTTSDFGEIGLRGISTANWMQNIVMGDLGYSADQLLSMAFPHLNKHYNYKLPVNKYLSQATKEFPDCKEQAQKLTFENIISTTIKDNRHLISMPGRSVKEIIAADISLSKKLYYIAHLEEHEIDVNALEKFLINIFINDHNIYQNITSDLRTNLNRVIRIYDYMKYYSTWQ